jgi:hypothetical protein
LVDETVSGSRITIRNISGDQYGEKYFILSGTTVYVHVQKPDRVVITPETSPTPPVPEVPQSVDIPGVFTFDSESDTVTLYRYIVKTGGNV